MEQFAPLHQKFDVVPGNTSDFISLPGNERDEHLNQSLITVGEPNLTMGILASDLKIPTGILEMPGDLLSYKFKFPEVLLLKRHSS